MWSATRVIERLALGTLERRGRQARLADGSVLDEALVARHPDPVLEANRPCLEGTTAMRSTKTCALRSLACAALFALAACKSSATASGVADAGGSLDASVGCANDPRGETYTPNLQHTGKAGLLHFTLVKSEPAPPIKGNNTWTLELSNKSGTALTGATLKVTPYMPDHGHGTSVKAQITESSSGYQIAPLYLFMGGIWQVTIEATSGAQSDSTVFSFCIGG